MIVIVAGGPDHMLPDLSNFLNENTKWVGVDRGLYILIKKGIIPDLAFGDFDSISNDERKEVESSGCQLNVYPAEKDETDLELAINWSLEQDQDEIYILGCTGGRLDHELINIQMLTKGLKRKKELIILDKQNKMIMRENGNYTISLEEEYKYVSFIPHTKIVENLSLKGFKYSLKDTNVSWGQTLCISNELVEKKGTYSFSNGILIVVKSRDA
jgi:thiamine pyrophosphokinase